MSTTAPDAPVVVPPQREAFVRNVRVLMARQGIRIGDVANRMEARYAYVWNRFTGRVAPDLDDLDAFAEVLSVAVADLVSDDEPTSTFIPGGAA